MNLSDKANGVFEVIKGFAEIEKNNKPEEILELFDKVRSNGTLSMLLSINTDENIKAGKYKKVIDYYRIKYFSLLVLSHKIYGKLDNYLIKRLKVTPEKHQAIVSNLTPTKVEYLGKNLFHKNIDTKKIELIGEISLTKIRSIGKDNFISEKMTLNKLKQINLLSVAHIEKIGIINLLNNNISDKKIHSLSELKPKQIENIGLDNLFDVNNSPKKINRFKNLKKFHTNILGNDFIDSDIFDATYLREILKLTEKLTKILKDHILSKSISIGFLRAINKIDPQKLLHIGEKIILDSLDNHKKLLVFSELNIEKIKYLSDYYNNDLLTIKKLELIKSWDYSILVKIDLNLILNDRLDESKLSEIYYWLQEDGQDEILSQIPIELIETRKVHRLKTIYNLNLTDLQKRRFIDCNINDKCDIEVIEYYGEEILKQMNESNSYILQYITIDKAKILLLDFLIRKDIGYKKKTSLLSLSSEQIEQLTQELIFDSRVNSNKIKMLEDLTPEQISNVTLDKILKVTTSKRLIEELNN